MPPSEAVGAVADAGRGAERRTLEGRFAAQDVGGNTNWGTAPYEKYETGAGAHARRNRKTTVRASGALARSISA